MGELSNNELSNFYGSAKACIYPKGLVTLESMACGTPVISLSNFKINPNVGFFVENNEETIKALSDVSKISRHDCRQWIEEKYTVERMVDDYEKVYYDILRKK